MIENIVITRSCVITESKAILDGAIVFDHPAPQASAFLTALYKDMRVNYPKFYKMDHLSKLGFLAGELIFTDPSIRRAYPDDEVAIILYNANSSLDADQQYYQTVSDIASPALFLYTLPNILIGELCIRHGIKGENTFFLEEEFNAKRLKEYVSILLEQEIAKACLCGWVDYLDDTYKACLLWVECNKEGTMFSVDTINTIYNQ